MCEKAHLESPDGLKQSKEIILDQLTLMEFLKTLESASMARVVDMWWEKKLESKEEES